MFEDNTLYQFSISNLYSVHCQFYKLKQSCQLLIVLFIVFPSDAWKYWYQCKILKIVWIIFYICFYNKNYYKLLIDGQHRHWHPQCSLSSLCHSSDCRVWTASPRSSTFFTPFAFSALSFTSMCSVRTSLFSLIAFSSNFCLQTCLL